MKDKKFDYVEIEGDIFISYNKDYEQEIRLKKYQYFLEKSGIPKFYWKIEFKDYRGRRSQKNVKKLIDYAENINHDKFKDVNLYLFGVNSTQKSSLACNLGKEAIKKGLKVKFVLAGILTDIFLKNQGYSREHDTYEQLQELENADIIIIDDAFDKNKSMLWSNKNSRSLIVSEWDRFLRKLIYNNQRIFITSNLTIENIKSEYSESLYELIDRNFITMQFLDSIKEKRKKRFENLFEEELIEYK